MRFNNKHGMYFLSNKIGKGVEEAVSTDFFQMKYKHSISNSFNKLVNQNRAYYVLQTICSRIIISIGLSGSTLPDPLQYDRANVDNI